MPTPRRAAFIITNMAFMPLFGSPTSQPVASSRFMTQVALALMPILCSIAPQRMPLRSPTLAVGLGQELRHQEERDARVPPGAPSGRASTRWRMFSVRSCSPAEMKILVPVID